MDSTLLVQTSPTERVDKETQSKEHEVIGNKNEEEKEEGDSRDMIAIEHVINDITDNYECEDLNTMLKLFPMVNSISESS